MRILLTGSSGQLGEDLQVSLSRLGEVIAPPRAACDLSRNDQLRSLVRKVAPAIIVNCGAYTNVNGAETDRSTAFAINAEAPGVLAEEATRLGSLLVHFSTDYVFDGTKGEPYRETDVTSPLNVYGASKLAGEQAVTTAGGRFLIFRTSWVYSSHGSNFLRTMLRLGRERETLSIVDDQVGAPTSTLQLADALVRVLTLEQAAGPTNVPSGLYHLTAAGAVSWCGFARKIFSLAREESGLRVQQVLPIASNAFPSPAARPAYSVLGNDKFIQTFGFALNAWDVALEEVMQQVLAEATGNRFSYS